MRRALLCLVLLAFSDVGPSPLVVVPQLDRECFDAYKAKMATCPEGIDGGRCRAEAIFAGCRCQTRKDAREPLSL